MVSAGSLCILMYSAIKPDDFFNGYRRSGLRLQGLQHCSETSETVWSTELRDLPCLGRRGRGRLRSGPSHVSMFTVARGTLGC